MTKSSLLGFNGLNRSSSRILSMSTVKCRNYDISNPLDYETALKCTG